MNVDAHFDVVIVGSGIAGALMAQELGEAGKRVLILEAGAGLTDSREDYLHNFYMAFDKVPESPYPPSHLADPDRVNAPRAGIMDLLESLYGRNPRTSYLIQKGPIPFTSVYERLSGGSTWHWMGTSIRMLPTDFKARTEYGVGRDWPLAYADIEPWYRKVEDAIGVAAEIQESPDGIGNQDVLEKLLGLEFGDHQFPMQRITPSLLDQQIASKVNYSALPGFENYVQVTSTPAARNSRYRDGRPACMGNANCVPICPIQAKYDATVTLRKALATGHVELWAHHVVDRLEIGKDGAVKGVHFCEYEREGEPQNSCGYVSGEVVVLAANAIENAKVLLNSTSEAYPNGVANSSDQVGRNLMDQPAHVAWGLMPDPVWPWRAPNSTAGIETLRDGAFRKDHAAFRIEIGNLGWTWPLVEPYTSVYDFIHGTNVSQLNPEKETLYGTVLRDRLCALLSRQFRLAFVMEQPSTNGNRVTVSRHYRDNLGIPRPEVFYDLDDYTKEGFVAARRVADFLFDRLGVAAHERFQEPTSRSLAPFYYKGARYETRGTGHIMGTHIMGDDPADSVVDKDQRAWDHPNLYVVGSGSFPSAGSANPTLTLAALTLKSAEHIKQGFGL